MTQILTVLVFEIDEKKKEKKSKREIEPQRPVYLLKPGESKKNERQHNFFIFTMMSLHFKHHFLPFVSIARPFRIEFSLITYLKH